MTNYAYLRVSTDGQDARNQKFGILDYCNKYHISPIEFIEDTTSGKVSWRERAIGGIITKANAGDLLVVSEISRLGRSTITATILGLAAQIERELISSRTKEALAKCKASGLKLGRPKGQAEILKLDDRREEIIAYLKKGINKTAISKLIECAPATLYSWLQRRKLHKSIN
jgi:DNA invertase Pin-like site-specific DNA recombinase